MACCLLCLLLCLLEICFFPRFLLRGRLPCVLLFLFVLVYSHMSACFVCRWTASRGSNHPRRSQSSFTIRYLIYESSTNLRVCGRTNIHTAPAGGNTYLCTFIDRYPYLSPLPFVRRVRKHVHPIHGASRPRTLFHSFCVLQSPAVIAFRGYVARPCLWVMVYFASSFLTFVVTQTHLQQYGYYRCTRKGDIRAAAL